MYENANNYLANEAYRNYREEQANHARLVREAQRANPQASAFSKVARWVSISIQAISTRKVTTTPANTPKTTQELRALNI